MAVMTTAFHPVSPNRRRRVRHRIQTPAYASFTAQSQAAMLDLHEIVDISEEGAAIQCHAPLEIDQQVNLCLDLADCEHHIYTSGQVVWANSSGRAGLHFSQLSPESVSRLREWLFVNVMAGVANGEADADTSIAPFIGSRADIAPPTNYTDTLEAVSAIQRQVEALGPDLAAALQLIAERAQTLVRASGAAIALAGADPDFMICRASAGPDAPPVGAPLQVGSGFSGECVKSGLVLRCDDTEFDLRVDRDNCRALCLRSILAVPVRVREKSIGLVEVFSAHPNAFSEDDSDVLQRLAETVLAAVNRAARAENLLPLGAAPPTQRFAPMPGSVLFASAPEEETKTEPADEKTSGGIHLPGSPLIILGVALALTFLALGYNLAPWIQTKLEQRAHSPIQTVLASSQPPKPENPPPSAPSVETASLDQLRQMAENNDPAAQNSLGLHYATGEGVKLDEREALRWFTKAAEQGNVAAQSKLGSVYLGGRGTSQDFRQAYFWMALARANGDETSKVLAPVAVAHLTRDQANSIELDADRWLQQHRPTAKPTAGH
jgi:TPR repeat protein